MPNDISEMIRVVNGDPIEDRVVFNTVGEMLKAIPVSRRYDGLCSWIRNADGKGKGQEFRFIGGVSNAHFVPSDTGDFNGILFSNMPFQSLILKPTAPSFGTTSEPLCTDIGFGDKESSTLVCFVFVSSGLEAWEVSKIFDICSLPYPKGEPGMWVMFVQTDEISGLPKANTFQLVRITDGTNILIPEVSVKELFGFESMSMINTSDDLGLNTSDDLGILQGDFSEDDHHIVTSIDGCEICYRLTQNQLLQYLLDQELKRLTV